MDTEYTVLGGDTFEVISRKKYGTEENAAILRYANPNVSEPIPPGVILFIPIDTKAPEDKVQTVVSGNKEEVSIFIQGKRFRYWSDVSIKTSLDSIDQVDFYAPINDSVKDVIKPFSFAPVEIFVGDSLFFKGTMVNALPTIEPTRKGFNVSCYSTPGVLNDCTAPSSLLPTEFYDQTLKEIAFTLCQPFSIDVVFRTDPGDVFQEVECDPRDKILPFLSKLAKKRNLVINSDKDGRLIFFKSTNGGSPVAKLEQGKTPVISIVPNFKPQEYYSVITGIEPMIIGGSGISYPLKNPLSSGVFRPFTYKVKDTEAPDMAEALNSKMGRMFGKAISYVLDVDTWLDPKGSLWEPDTTIILHAPDVSIDNPYEFLIRDVTFTQNSKHKSASLKLCLPGSFSGTIPESLPWD